MALAWSQSCTNLSFRSDKAGPWEPKHKRRTANSKQPVVLLSHLVPEMGVNGGLLVNI